MEAIVVGSHLFKSLEVEGRRRLLESGFVLCFDPGDILVREGDLGDMMYLISEGSVRIETRTPTGTLQLAELGRGACLGEVAVLTGSPRTATVTALTPVAAVAFTRRRVHAMLDAHPRVRHVLETLVEGRARDTLDKILGG